MRRLILLVLAIGGVAYSANYTRFADLIIKNTMSIGSNSAANSKAVLDLSSTTKGLLAPRMTTAQRTAISSPPTGLLVYDTDLVSLYQYNGSAWVAVGSSASGSGTGVREYISNSGAEQTTAGWSTYADAAATSPADGTGGSPNVTLSRTTTGSEIIRETASFKLAKDAANRQGQGFSYDFTVDPHDYKNGAPVNISFDYKTTANYASSDIKVYVYDRDAASLITVFDGASLTGALPASTNGTKFTGYFWPTSTTSDDYRLIFHITSTNASAYDFIWDSVHVGSSNLVPGFIGSEWTSWTPTGSWSTNTTYSGRWRRNGDTNEYQVKIALSGAPTSASLTVNLPSGHTIDTNKLASGTDGSSPLAGSFARIVAAASGYTGFVGYSSTTSVNVLSMQGATGNNPYASVTQAVPGTFANGDVINLVFKVPLANQVASASLSTTETLFMGSGVIASKNSGSQSSSGSFQDVSWTESFDNLGAFDGTTFTAPRPMRVHVHGIVAFAASATGTRQCVITNSGASTTYFIGPELAGSASFAGACPFSATVDLAQGGTIRIRAYQNSGGALNYSTTTNASTLFIEEVFNPTIFSTYGLLEILTATSNTKTPSASGNYHALTGNSLTLSAGTWRLFGSASLGNSGSSPTYSSGGVGWFSANGGDSGSAPTALSSASGLTVLSVVTSNVASQYLGLDASNNSVSSGPIIVRCSSSCTVYLVTYSNQTTSANARIIAYLNAERLQ